MRKVERRAPEADHLLDRLGFLERQREGTADQSGAEDDDLAEFRHSGISLDTCHRPIGRFRAPS